MPKNVSSKSVHVQKGGKKKKKNPKLRVSQQYVWNVLSNVVKDLQQDAFLSISPTITKATKELCGIIRSRDIPGYMDFCDKYSLVELNIVNEDPSSQIRVVRALRLLTCACKYDFPQSPYDKTEKAKDTFLKFEAQCQKTNENKIFMSFDQDHDSDSTYHDVFLFPVMEYARDFISQTLGKLPLDRISALAHHGPGSSRMKSGNNAVPIAKFLPKFDVTSSAQSLFFNAMLEDPRWKTALYDWWYAIGRSKAVKDGEYTLPDLSLEGPWEDIEQPYLPKSQLTHVVDTSMIAFVPKNSKTDRTIAVEPTGNVWLQLGVGEYIKERLKHVWGIDISTQLKNQALAYIGSKTNSLATVDLSGASDTISLAWLNLFHDEWAELLLSLRCSRGLLPSGEVITFEKVSSMGNGYTFPLETLIFASIIYGVIRVRGGKWVDFHQSIAVYGDDIIVPTELFLDLASVLKRTGFSLNLEKTFTDGPVRESCGKDFYYGEAVSRPTLKACPTEVWQLNRDHNLLFHWEHDYKISLEHTRTYIQSLVPKGQAFYGPYNRFSQIEWIQCYEPPATYRLASTNECKFVINKKDPKKSHVEHCDSCCQHEVGYNVKGIILAPPKFKPGGFKKYTIPFFSHLLRLNRGMGSPPWWETMKFNSNQAEPLLLFSKKILASRSRRSFIPKSLWQGTRYDYTILCSSMPRDKTQLSYFNLVY